MLVFLSYAFLVWPSVVSSQTSKSTWTATADNFQPGNEPSKALDGNNQTFWHSAYSPTLQPLPHTYTIDIKTASWITGLSYQPRQDSSNNGNIGQHMIQLSTDGQTFGAPVVTGTWLDDKTTKVVPFAPTFARYVRITAQTEAGNRGPWSSAAEFDLQFGTSGAPSGNGVGKWGTVIDWPIVPVAAALIYSTGQVLTWSSFRPDTFGGGTGTTYTATYTPSTGVVSQAIITNVQHDMFCPGISVDANGRVVVTGGNDASKTSIYTPSSGGWTSAANMQISRGYQASAALSDGRVFTIGGSWSGGQGNKNGEVYNPSTNAWTLLPGCPVAPMLTADAQGVYRQDNHGWLFGWKSGSVFQAGPSKNMNWYTTAGSGGQSSAGTRGSDPDAMNGNAVMFDAGAGKILTVGGAVNYQDVDATGNANIITIGNSGTAVSVQQIGSMAYPRAFANSVALPDGKVLVIGGQSHPIPFADSTAQLTPELFNPATNTFTKMAPMVVPRVYHSIALLMPDATVLSGGGGLCGTGCATNHFNAQVFSPPYLFTSSGALASRPVINSVSTSSVAAGGKITVTTGGAVAKMSLVRMGSATHSVNTDQRRIALSMTGSGTSYTVTLPSDAGIALPGYWMLFAMDSGGVPSVAKTIKVTG